MRHAAAVALCLSFPVAAAAGPFPTRGGESGLLDVPDAEVMGAGEGRVGGELRFDRVPGTPNGFGPFPLSLVTGLGGGLEAGVAVREWGQPGDPRPAPLLFGAAAKLRLLGGEASRHAVAVDATIDRFNWKAVSGMRLIASTAEVGRLRFAGHLGAEAHGPRPHSIGGTAGIAVSILHRSRTEAVLEALTGPRGSMFGAALRWSVTPRAGVSLGLTWLPGDDGFRASLGFGTGTPAARKHALPPSPTVEDMKRDEQPAAPAAPEFLDERPRFRLRIRGVLPPGETPPRHLQHAPLGPDTAGGSPAPAPQAKPAPRPRDDLREPIATREPKLASGERRNAPDAGRAPPERRPPAGEERGSPVQKAAPGAAAKPARAGTALHPGRAKGMVAAVRAFYFPAPGLRLTGPGKKALRDIADLAARRSCTLLVWARTANPDLIPEAERLSEELTAVAAAGPLPRERIAKRVTVRPAAAGVEVTVSAHCAKRERAGSAGARR